MAEYMPQHVYAVTVHTITNDPIYVEAEGFDIINGAAVFYDYSSGSADHPVRVAAFRDFVSIKKEPRLSRTAA